MNKSATTAPQTTVHGSETSHGGDASAGNQVTALLLDVLRKVNREVKSTPELNAAACRAVANYESIARDLATLTDPQLLTTNSKPRT